MHEVGWPRRTEIMHRKHYFILAHVYKKGLSKHCLKSVFAEVDDVSEMRPNRVPLFGGQLALDACQDCLHAVWSEELKKGSLQAITLYLILIPCLS